MRILQIGSTGTIGSAVVETLAERGHELVVANWTADPARPHTSLAIDVTDSASIAAVYEQAGPVDAVVNTVGSLALAPLGELSLEQVRSSVGSKLLSQVDIVLQGLAYVRPGGSFTLVSGIMSRIPWRGGVSAAVVNGGIDAFVLAVAAELDLDRRINSVSPSIVEESILKYGGDNPLPGHQPVPAAGIAQAYLRLVEGIENGTTLTVGF